MNRFEMDYDDSPREAAYLSLIPQRHFAWDIFGTNTSGAQSDVSQGLTQYIHYADQAKQDLTQGLNTATGYMNPYYQAGTSGMQAYAGLLGIPGASQTYNPQQYLNNVPGYQWGQQQGLNALNASTNAAGMYGSGPQRQADVQYGQNYGNQYYNTLMQQLSGLGTMGQNAGTQLGQWNQNTASQQVPIDLGIGQQSQGAMNTMAGLNLQNQQMQGQGLGSMIGLAGSLLAAPMTGGGGGGGGGMSLLGSGMGMLGSMFGGGGGGGGGGYNIGGGLQNPF
jgi:hypothetical protein